MKRLTALVLALVLALGLAACGKQESGPALHDKLEQSKPQTQTDPAQSQTKAPEKKPAQTAQEPDEPEKPRPASDPEATLEGTYVRDSVPDGLQIVLQVRTLGDTLLLEYSSWRNGELDETWAEEFWPDPEAQADGQYPSVTGLSQRFTAQYGSGAYWKTADARTLVRTEEGLMLQGPYGVETYTADDTCASPHTSFDEQMASLRAAVKQAQTEGPVGCWTYDDGYACAWLELEEGGVFRYLCKPKSMPVEVYEGAWVRDPASGNLECLAERLGGGILPYRLSLWYAEENGGLMAMDVSEEPLGLLSEGMYFWPAQTGTWSADYPVSWKMGTYTECYRESGILMVEEDEPLYYSYYVPQLLLDSVEAPGTAGEINEAIYERFGLVAGQELDRIYSDEPPVFHTVDYSASTYAGLEQLAIWTDTYVAAPDCAVYCYDRARDAWLDTPALLEYMGIPAERFLQAVRTQAQESFEASFGFLSEQERRDYGYDERLAWTVSDEAVNLDIPVYVTEYGEVVAIARIGSLAGSDWIYMALYLRLDTVG